MPLCSLRKQTNSREYSLTLTMLRIRWSCTLPGQRQNFRILVVDHNHPLWTYMAIQLSPLTASLTWAVNYTHLAVLPLRYSEGLVLPRVWWVNYPMSGDSWGRVSIQNAALQCSGNVYGAKTWTMLKSDLQKIEAFHMSCHRCILGIRWYDFMSNADVVDRIPEESIAAQVQRRRVALFGHVRWLSDAVPANVALRLCINAWAGRQVNTGPTWKRQHDCPRKTWVRQVELDSGITADAAWTADADRDMWRALRPTAGHAVQWVREWYIY